MASGGIVSRAAQCEKILSYLHAGAKTEAEKTWIETQAQRLDVWSETLGVRAHAKYSIEHRLASNQEVSTIVKQLLDALSVNLRQYYSLAALDTLPFELNKELDSDGETSDSESSHGSTASDASEPTLEESTARIHAGLTRLGHLAVRIRREGVKRAAKAARDFVPVDTLGQPLEPEFRSCARASLLRAFPPDRHNGDSTQLLSADLDAPVASSTTSVAPAWPVPQPDPIDLERVRQQVTKSNEPPYIMPEYLRERFADTMVRRWKRICYNRKHAQELAGLTVKPLTGNEDVTPKRLPLNKEVTRVPAKIPEAFVKPQKVSVAKTVMTEYSVLDPATKINMNVDVQQPSRSIITGVKAGDLRYPKPPDAAKGIDIFSCPLCKLPLPIQFLNKRQWQLHVMQDLAPYFCLVRKCHSPSAIYSTHEEWLEHVRTEHMESSWSCNSCDQELAFSDPQAFEEHFQLAHTEEAGLDQLPFLTKLAEKKKAYMYTECYFCGFVPAGYEQDRSNEDAQKLIKEHMVADHMKAFALDCLPWDYAGAGGNSLYQDSQSRDSGSEEAREDILHDTALTEMLQQSEDMGNEIDDHPALITSGSLASIKDRWDSIWSLRQMTQNWLENVVDVMASPDDDVAQWDSQQREIATVPVIESKKRELKAQPFAETAEQLRDVYRARDSDSVRTYVISKAKAEIAKKTTPQMEGDSTSLNEPSMITTEAVQPAQDAARTVLAEDALQFDRELRIYSLIENQDVSGIVQWVQENTLTFGNLKLPWEGQPLHAAVFTGNAEVVKVLLAVDQTEDHLVSHVGSALSLAVRLKHTAIIDILIAEGCSSIAGAGEHAAPLAIACALGDLELVKKLAAANDTPLYLDFTVDVEAINVCPLSPSAEYPTCLQISQAGNALGLEQPIWIVNGSLLTIAALYDHEQLVRYLAQRVGDDIVNELVWYVRRDRREVQEGDRNSNRNELTTTLGLIAEANNGTMVSRLLGLGARVESHHGLDYSALQAAANADSGDALKLLLEHITPMADRQDLLDAAFAKACNHASLNTIRTLRNEGAMVNEPEGGCLALEHAYRRGDIPLATYLLENGADTSRRPQSEHSVLVVSCMDGAVDMADLLLSHGAAPDASNAEGVNAIMMAAKTVDIDCLTLLLRYGASIDGVDREGWTALHYSAEYDRVQAAEILLAHGAQVNCANRDGETPLHRCITSDSRSVTEVLLQHGAQTDLRCGKLQETPLMLAARHNRLSIIRILLDHGVDMDAKNAEGLPAIAIACVEGRTEIAQMLIDRGSPLEGDFGDGATLLSMTIAAGKAQCLQILLEAGLKPGFQDEWNKALLLSVGQGSMAVLPILLEGADIECRNVEAETPLMVATTRHGHDEMEFLVSRGASPNARDGNGASSLHFAAGNGCKACLEVLLRSGSNVEAQDNYGVTPLQTVCMYGVEGDDPLGCLEYLIARGASVNSADAGGVAPLIKAIPGGTMDMVELLILQGAKLDAISHAGDTALIVAAKEGYDGMTAKVLLDAGANPGLRAGRLEDGLTALAWALIRHNFNTACCLIDFGAPLDITTVDMPDLLDIELGYLKLIRRQVSWGPRSKTQLSRSDAATIGDAIVKRAQALRLAKDPLAVFSRAQLDTLAQAASRARERAKERAQDQGPRTEQKHIEMKSIGMVTRKRTKTGCLTCRKRRIKCGEERPSCNNCIKSQRHCEGYAQRAVFERPLFRYSAQPDLPDDAVETVSTSDEPDEIAEARSESLREPDAAIDATTTAYKMAKKGRDYALDLI